MNTCRNVKKIETFFVLEYDRQDQNKKMQRYLRKGE